MLSNHCSSKLFEIMEVAGIKCRSKQQLNGELTEGLRECCIMLRGDIIYLQP